MATASAIPGGHSINIITGRPVQLEHPALLPGFPANLTSDLCWVGADFTGKSDHVYVLTEEHQHEIREAIKSFRALELDGEFVSRRNFPLPGLSVVLDKLSRDVHEGRGFAVLRGLDLDNYSIEELTLAYLGVQSYVADQRGRQDKLGNVFVHIVADDSASEHHRHSTKPVTFHNEEAGDVVSWLTRSTAAAGGRCILSSAYTVYNALAGVRPDLIRALSKSDWPFALPNFRCRPVMFFEASKLIMNFGRAPLLGSSAHPRPTHLPALTATQTEALDAIEIIARATEFSFGTQAGDIHFINNLAVLHRREGFVNGPLPTERRHLVRMRLRNTQRGWKIPQALERDWSAAFEKDRQKDVYHLEPMPDCYLPLRQHPN